MFPKLFILAELLFALFCFYWIVFKWGRKIIMTQKKKEEIEETKIMEEFTQEEAEKIKEVSEKKLKKSKQKINNYIEKGKELE